MGPWQFATPACAAVVAWNARAVEDARAGLLVDEYIAAQRRARQIPGMAVGIMREGQIVKATGYGVSNVEHDAPATPETAFQTASVGKQFTAAAIMILVECGSVKLDDKITRFFPEGAKVWKEVTVRHLLSHTSGIPDYGAEDEKKDKAVVDFRKDYTEEELLQKFVSLKLANPPGHKWEYSNTGYVLLGMLIHRVTGQPYGDFLQQRIFRPLGMKATRVISEADIVPHRAAGYRIVDGKLKNQEWVSPSLNTLADGGLYTTVLDMAKWDAALYTDNVIREADLELMWTPTRLDGGKTEPYGLGWGIIKRNRHRMVRHRGSWQGFAAAFHRYVDDRFSVVLFANLQESKADPETIARKVATFYIPSLVPPDEPPDPLR